MEIENLSSESLTLVYADFRVKQTYGEDRREIPCLYSLQEAFDVILSKLDNVDDAKRLRYRYVYAKLRDFEDYLISFGVDTTSPHRRRPRPPGQKCCPAEHGRGGDRSAAYRRGPQYPPDAPAGP